MRKEIPYEYWVSALAKVLREDYKMTLSQAFAVLWVPQLYTAGFTPAEAAAEIYEEVLNIRGIEKFRTGG